MVLAGAGVYGYGHLTGNDTSGLANVWVDTSTGNNTCQFSSTLVAYSDTNACSDFSSAYALTAGGGTVKVKCGSYDAQAFASGSSHTAMTVFQSENPLCATVQSTTATTTFIFNNGSKYITLDGFTINNGPDGYPISDTSSIGTNINTDHISILNNYINVGVKGNGLLMSLHASQNWIIDGNTFGPSCCGATAGPSLEGIRVGKPGNGAADCTTQACHIQITNNLFQFLNRAAATWPSSGWGTVPDVSCPLCHNDAIHFFGAQDVQINYNRFYGDECNGIFFESSGNSITSDVDIIGNAIGALANGCNGGVAFNFVGTGWAGTFNVKFNSSAENINLNFNSTSAFNVNVIGNYGRLFVNGSGTSACGTGTGAPSATLTFRYNVWSTATACDATDTAGVADEWVSSVEAPAVGQDMHLTSGATAIGFVPTAVSGGCPSIDFDGDVPSSPCNAGADQTASTSTSGASQAICSPSPCTDGPDPSGSSGGTNYQSLGNISDGTRTQARSLTYYVPTNLKHDGSADGSPAAVFQVIGGGGTCGGAAPLNELRDGKTKAAANANEMVVVLLQPEDCNVVGHRTGWAHPQIDCNSTVCGSTSTPTDEPYIAAAYAWACSGAGVALLHIDCTRLYMVGASSGGAMPREVQCDNVYGNSGRFRGIAWVSNSPQGPGSTHNFVCPSSNKTTFTMHVIGMSSGSDATSADLPLGSGSTLHTVLSFDNTRAGWASYLGTCGSAVSTAIGTPSAANTQYDYTCTGASTPMFRAVKIINGGHSFCNLDDVQGTCTGNVPPVPANSGTNRNGWSTMDQVLSFFTSGVR